MRPLLLVLAILFFVPGSSAQDPVRIDGLGAISFPNSGEEGAQEPFYRGVMLLHSFEFAPAAVAFREAQQEDPTFALAYWGEAMTYNHPLWRQKNRDAAFEALGRLAPTAAERRARAGTEREGRYLDALELLYGEGDKTEQDRRYMEAMSAMQADYPEDDEARTFHALSILGSRNGERDFATYMRAAATALPVFQSNPDHPGAAHYIIHSFDDPIHAPLGLPAAIAYSEIAPDAAHAQHMTSHIFVAMGDWDRVIKANIRASNVQDGERARAGRGPNVCGHYSSWLHYGYLMTGNQAEAERLMDACHSGVVAGEASWYYFVQMRARHVVDTADWSLVDRWTADPPGWSDADRTSAAGVFGGPAFTYGLTDAIARIHTGDLAAATAFLEAGWEPHDGRSLQLRMLRGLVDFSAGDEDGGLELLRRAAEAESAMPFEFGPPIPVQPAHEALGEALLNANRTREAQEVFREAILRTPGRTSATAGLAKAGS